MAYFEDFSPCTYGGDVLHLRARGARTVPPPVAIGWLDAEHSYPRGPVEPAFRAKLGELFRNAWQWAHFRGVHECDICAGEQARTEEGLDDSHRRDLPVGIKNLVVPGTKMQFYAPELIIHYIDAHQYQPPKSFQDAVLACAPSGSEEYFYALIISAGPVFAADLEETIAELCPEPHYFLIHPGLAEAQRALIRWRGGPMRRTWRSILRVVKSSWAGTRAT